MNFACSSKELDYSYLGLAHHKVGNGWNLYIDNGWRRIDDYFYKGLSSSWCKIYTGNSIRIETNTLRDFPIYHTSELVTNFQKLDALVPVDGIVTVNEKIEINYKKDFYARISNETIAFDNCHDLLFDALVENVDTFASNNNQTVYIPAQGGIDTLTIRSVFDYLGVSYQLFDLPLSKPKCSPLRAELLKNHWGFTQVDERPNSVVVTGFYGDEWVLRNPYYVHLLLSNRGLDLTEQFDDIENCYMKKYFENYRKKCSTRSTHTIAQLLTQICNDFQIWHLNDTKFLSPLKHISLLNLLSADNDTVIGQVTDAKLSKSIIGKCNPNLLEMIDSTKNQKDPVYFWQD